MILSERSKWTLTSFNCRKNFNIQVLQCPGRVMALITLLPETLTLREPKWLCIFSSEAVYWGPIYLPSSLPEHHTPPPHRPTPDPGGQRASHHCLSVFTNLRLPIQIQHRAGDSFAWPSYLCAAFYPLALPELYANPTCDSPPSQVSLTLKHTP